MADANRFQEIFTYLSAPAVPVSHLSGIGLIFIFCRADIMVARKAAEIADGFRQAHILATGGVGKDSGALERLQMAEAIYIAGQLRWKFGIADYRIWVEPLAANGTQNSQFGLEMIKSSELAIARAALVIHATSLRRLAWTHQHEARKLRMSWDFFPVATDHPFDPANPTDCREAAQEMLRLADWPEKFGLDPVPDLPPELVEYCRRYLDGQK